MYGLYTSGQMSAKAGVYCVYNSPPWSIPQLTMNDMTTLWVVSMFLQENL